MTTLLVDGYGFRGFMPRLDIVKARAGDAVVTVPYDNMAATEPNIAAAAIMCRDMAADVSGPVLLVGVSMGAQVLCRLLRDLGTEKAGPWEFVLLANPEHKYTGRRKTAQYGGLGVPVDTPYEVCDVAAQYDYWADVGSGWAATLNSLIVGNTVHTTGYFSTRPALDYPHLQVGNVKHMWTPYTGTVWGGRARVERGYTRPVML